MNPLALVTVVLLVWVFMLMVWLIHQEVRLRAQQQAQMRLHAMFIQDLAEESRTRGKDDSVLRWYIDAVAFHTLPDEILRKIRSGERP